MTPRFNVVYRGKAHIRFTVGDDKNEQKRLLRTDEDGVQYFSYCNKLYYVGYPSDLKKTLKERKKSVDIKVKN